MRDGLVAGIAIYANRVLDCPGDESLSPKRPLVQFDFDPGERTRSDRLGCRSSQSGTAQSRSCRRKLAQTSLSAADEPSSSAWSLAVNSAIFCRISVRFSGVSGILHQLLEIAWATRIADKRSISRLPGGEKQGVWPLHRQTRASRTAEAAAPVSLARWRCARLSPLNQNAQELPKPASGLWPDVKRRQNHFQAIWNARRCPALRPAGDTHGSGGWSQLRPSRSSSRAVGRIG